MRVIFVADEKIKYDYFWINSSLIELEGIRYGIAYALDIPEIIIKNSSQKALAIFKDLDEVTYTFELRDGMWADYLRSDLGYPLFSTRLKNLLEEYVPIKLYSRWIRVRVKAFQQDEVVVYYIPLFENLTDVIDYDHSNCDDNDVYTAYYSLKKIKELDFFAVHSELNLQEIKDNNSVPRDISSDFIISKSLKDRLINNQITGIVYRRIYYFNDLYPELEKQWSELLDHCCKIYDDSRCQCNFVFNVDYAYWGIRCYVFLYKVGRTAICEGLEAYQVKYQTEDGFAPSAELEKNDPEKYQAIKEQYQLDIWKAMEQGYEIIDELTEEEYIKNNLRRLFEYYDCTVYLRPYIRSEIRPAYGALDIPVGEIVEVLSGKAPIKDSYGKIRFLPLPERMKSKAEILSKAAEKIGELEHRAVLTQETATPEYLFGKYREIKSRIVNGDGRRSRGTQEEQKQQRVKDYVQEMIADYELRCLRIYDSELYRAMVNVAKCRWQGRA